MTSLLFARNMGLTFNLNPARECVVAEAAQEHLSTAESFAGEAPTDSPLTDRDQQMLALERQWWKYAGAKEQAIRELFDLSATHYYQILNALIDTEAALAHDPMLVKRLRRLRTSRQRARTARRLGSDA
ncbi:MAG: hypothetical protein JWN19_1940 [Arthrobacter sp.]|nr:hypothetical protein [Arthrobacter sp.]